MEVTSVLAVQMVDDLDTAVAWYAALLGREPDRRPMPPSAEWDLTPGGGLQVYLDPEHAGGHHAILAVDDTDAAVAALADHGITGEPFTVPSGQFRLCMLEDPSGNVVVVSQVLSVQPTGTP